MGWHCGDKPLKEWGMGFFAYCHLLPILGVIVIAFYLYMNATSFGTGNENSFEPDTQGAHPIVVAFNGASKFDLFVLFCQLSIVAPLVEEVMFRGVLYRHLREWSVRWGRRLSIVISTFISCLIFAAVHPQGLIAIPVLMSIATVLVFAREWRGSLLPGIVAHGMNNGLVFLYILILLG